VLVLVLLLLLMALLPQPMWKSRLNRWDFAPKTWQMGLWRDVM